MRHWVGPFPFLFAMVILLTFRRSHISSFLKKSSTLNPLRPILALKEKSGYWLGPVENVGDTLTYSILTNDTVQVINRSVVCPVDPSHPNHRVTFHPNLASAQRAPSPLSPVEDASSDDVLHASHLSFSSSPLRVDPSLVPCHPLPPGTRPCGLPRANPNLPPLAFSAPTTLLLVLLSPCPLRRPLLLLLPWIFPRALPKRT